MLPAEELTALADDIRTNGLREPILVHPVDGTIVDGRNRYVACRQAGVEPRYVAWAGDGDLIDLVLSRNLHRRHLTEAQRALVASRVATLRQGRPTTAEDKPARVPVLQAEAATMLGVSERAVRQARVIEDHGSPELVEAVSSGAVSLRSAVDVATVEPEEQGQILALGEREIIKKAKEIRARRGEERRGKQRAAIAAEGAAPTLPDGSGGRYGVIYADPPWEYATGSTDSGRQIERHYPTMTLDAIKTLPVRDLGTLDSVLLLWTTSPKLAEAMSVIEAWGYRYRTCMVWDKVRVGMGYWWRQRHELLLLAERGHPPFPEPAQRHESILTVERAAHSAKPVEAYRMIERMFPGLPRIELFARNRREGWSAWGNEVPAAEVVNG
jgi:N6-adenosine-specific RNA methylase IME4/ParB-like chromosome segregation protein Spo0J